MIYLQRRISTADSAQAVEIAVVEDTPSAARYEAQGFVRCSFEMFREAWRLRDLRSLERLRSSVAGMPADQRGIYSSPS